MLLFKNEIEQDVWQWIDEFVIRPKKHYDLVVDRRARLAERYSPG